MAVAPAVLALSVPVGGVGALNRARPGEESDCGAQRGNVPGMDGDIDGGGSLTLPGPCVRVEVSGGEDANVLGVEDRLRETGKQFLGVFREKGERERVDGELCFVGGEAEGQPGRVSHGE